MPALKGIRLGSPGRARRIKGKLLVIGSEKVLRVGEGGLEVRRDLALTINRLKYQQVALVLRPVEVFEGLEEVI